MLSETYYVGYKCYNNVVVTVRCWENCLKVVINQNKLLNAYGSQVVDQRCPEDIIRMNSDSPETPLQPQESKDERMTQETEEQPGTFSRWNHKSNCKTRHAYTGTQRRCHTQNMLLTWNATVVRQQSVIITTMNSQACVSVCVKRHRSPVVIPQFNFVICCCHVSYCSMDEICVPFTF
jgi:hypothetical protein